MSATSHVHLDCAILLAAFQKTSWYRWATTFPPHMCILHTLIQAPLQEVHVSLTMRKHLSLTCQQRVINDTQARVIEDTLARVYLFVLWN